MGVDDGDQCLSVVPLPSSIYHSRAWAFLCTWIVKFRPCLSLVFQTRPTDRSRLVGTWIGYGVLHLPMNITIHPLDQTGFKSIFKIGAYVTLIIDYIPIYHFPCYQANKFKLSWFYWKDWNFKSIIWENN